MNPKIKALLGLGLFALFIIAAPMAYNALVKSYGPPDGGRPPETSAVIIPPPETSAENPPAQTSASSPAQTSANPPAQTTTNPPAQTTTNPPAQTTTNPPAQTATNPPAQTTTNPPAQTTKPPAQTTANPPASDEEGNPLAPDFTVYDQNGNPVRLSDFRGKKPVVLNFWASWCGPCRAEMGHFDAAYAKYGGVAFMMVNLTDGQRETKSTAQKFIEDSGYRFPVYFDTKGSAASAYGITSIPVTVFISKSGYIVSKSVGQMSESALSRSIGLIT